MQAECMQSLVYTTYGDCGFSLVQGGLHCVGVGIVSGQLQLLYCSLTAIEGSNTLFSNNT